MWKNSSIRTPPPPKARWFWRRFTATCMTSAKILCAPFFPTTATPFMTWANRCRFPPLSPRRRKSKRTLSASRPSWSSPPSRCPSAFRKWKNWVWTIRLSWAVPPSTAVTATASALWMRNFTSRAFITPRTLLRVWIF